MGLNFLLSQKNYLLDTEAKGDYIERSNAGFMYHFKNKFTDDQDKNVRIAQLQDKQNSLVVVSSHDDGDMKLLKGRVKKMEYTD